MHLFGQIFGRKEVLVFSSIIGIFLTALEWFCYFVLFVHISHHNNSIGRAVLSQSAIKQRNRTNAISMLGLFITWFLEVIYITFVGIVGPMFDQEWFRDYSAAFKDLDFVLIPWIQILTSSPIKRFRHKLTANMHQME